jgi:copper oxidase (laccase) domain-containing protein
VGELVSDGSNTNHLVAAIGPGISSDSFEVGPEVLAAFPAAFHQRTSWGTPSIDLAAFLEAQLRNAGVRQVDRVWVDTFDSQAWHSHRRDGEHSGRNATICIVEPPRTDAVLNHGEIP